MQLVSLKLQNCCQHKDLLVTFEAGVNGILGPNGSGKTNLVRAIQFALTGSFPGKSKDRCISRFAGVDDESYVTLEFRYNDTACQVQRWLSSATCTLILGTEEINGAGAVNAKLSEILGLSASAMNNYVFVQQDETTSAICCRPADRMKVINTLFDLDRVEFIRTALHDYLKVVQVPLLPSDADDLPKKVAELSARVDELTLQEKELKAVRGDADLEKLGRELALSEAKVADYQHAETGLLSTEMLIHALEQVEIPAIEKDLQQADTDVATTQQELTRLNLDAAIAAEKVKAVQMRLELKRQADDVMTEISQLEAEGSSSEHQTPDVFDVAKEKRIAALDAEVSTLRATLGVHKSVLSGLSSDGGVCPACGTVCVVTKDGEMMDFTVLLERTKNLIEVTQAELTKAVGELTELMSERQVATRATKDWQAWKASYGARINSVQYRAEKIDFGVLDGPDPKLPGDRREAIAQYTGELERVKSVQHKLQVDFTKKQHELADAEQWANELKGYEPLPDINGLRQHLRRLTAAQAKIDSLGHQLELYTKEAEDLMVRAEKVQGLREQGAKVKDYRGLLEPAYDILHRENYPRKVASKRFNLINSSWNEMLEQLEVRFTVEIKEDTSIILTYPDGQALLEDASGGEKCCAAIAFLLAINKHFAARVGFIILDEPTYGLDAEHLTHLLGLFSQVQTYALAQGLQVLIITHEDQLKSGINHIIELEGASD